ncbi:MAG: hypothetical protein HYX32_14705 [Actinobacteria bacterium]|nr:hypothetical protein [Actinomycetota bacterium]
MADRHDDIDMATLKEVERLLHTTTFVTADELVAGGPVDMPPPAPPTQPVEAIVESDDTSPLPKRR